jgi:signal transduction histidine kinase
VAANPKQIRAERYVEIGTIIQRDTAILIDQWSKRAVEEEPGAQRLHHQTLLDHLPLFLAELGTVLADVQVPDLCPHCRLAEVHGKQRWELGWSLSEVVRDYRLLRLVILDHLDQRLDRPLLLREIQAVGLAIDEAIEASVEEFVGKRDEQFQQLRQSLETADRLKNEFLAVLAHELRNPLAPLLNALAVVRLRGDTAEAIRPVRELMERQVQQMGRLVDDLLDVTRIANNKLVLRKERLDLRAAIEEAVQMNAPLREVRRQQIAVSLPPGPLWVEGDQARLVQVVVNLLNNASKYTQEEGRIEVSALLEGSEVVVRVKDNGIGIPPEKLSQVFDLFAQLHLGEERTQEGLGIGLTLVRRLTELHGGIISASSPGTGRGSEFVVRLPEARTAAGTPQVENPGRLNSSGRHILIVEDNPDGRESLAVLLRLLGHRVDVAEDGPRGVEKALALRPEVVLLDIGLPILDGYDVARRVRQGLGNDVLLVALTGHGQPEDLQRANEAGFNAHLVKPVEPEALQALLTRTASA